MNTIASRFRVLSLVILAVGTWFSEARADAWDCMSRPVAERLVSFLADNPYVFDYCDACADFEEGGMAGYLIRVESTRIVQCSWDPGQWSVEVDFETICWGMVTRQGKVAEVRSPEELAAGQGPEPVYRDDPSYRLTLNYHWTIADGEVQRLLEPVQYEEDMGDFNGFVEFPNWRKVKGKRERVEYLKWLRQVN